MLLIVGGDIIKNKLMVKVGDIIKKISYKRKLWLDHRSQRISKKGAKNVRKKFTYKYVDFDHTHCKSRKVLTAPTIFSLSLNPRETIEYFERILEECTQHKFDENIVIDLAPVTSITTDAIMYLLAIISNIKSASVYRTVFSGNVPRDKAAQQIFLSSGFKNLVSNRLPSIDTSNDKVQIITGKDVCPKDAKKICDFVSQHSALETRQLYSSIIELMTNVHQHAYNQSHKDITTLKSCWYIFAENFDSHIQFVFMDTGEGIPNTINKKFRERLPRVMTDEKLIHSAFLGENRSETKQPNRGNGLPLIYTQIVNRYFDSLTVISNKGMCEYNYASVTQTELTNAMQGTLFIWSIAKKQEVI